MSPQVLPPQPTAVLTVAKTPVDAGETVTLIATGSSCQVRGHVLRAQALLGAAGQARLSKACA